MKIETTTSRPSRDQTWTQVIHDDADLADAIEALIMFYRAAEHEAAGKSRFGIQTIDIRFTF